MKKPVQNKAKPTTQGFIEIKDIVDDLVMLSGNQACLIIEVKATNFSLQSSEEQQSRIISYASLLNSLSFPIQILIVSRKLDISNYVNLLEDEASKAKNPSHSQGIRMYKDFVAQLVKTNTVLDKKFYLTISFSFLEKGAGAVTQMNDQNAFIKDARNLLHSKAKSIISELLRIGLKSEILEKQELIELFYEIYNPDSGKAQSLEGTSTLVQSKT